MAGHATISKVLILAFFSVAILAILIFLLDNRGRFVPRDSRFDEGRNRFAEGRRDNMDRDLREPQKWEHDMSTHR